MSCKLLNNSLDHERKKVFDRTFYLVYTGLFALMALTVYYAFIRYDSSFITTGDGFCQHYRALIYYSNYLRDIIANLFAGNGLVIPQFDFSVGSGSDVITTFSYYTIGDPFSVFCVFVPERYIYIYYAFAVFLRLYCAGLAFIWLCKETGRGERTAVMTGALVYAFCAFSVFAGSRHPYFINPMVYLPIIFVAIEKIVDGKNPLLMSFIVAIATLSNFYFFYIIVLITVIYALAKLICAYYSDISKALVPFVKIAVSSVVGVMMGTVLFLPTVLAFLGDNRSEVSKVVSVIYPVGYYLGFLQGMSDVEGMGYWTLPGTVFLSIPAAAMLFSRRGKNKTLKAAFAVCVLLFAFPIVGKVFNGFSYVSNRWSFAFALLCCYIIVAVWDDIHSPKKKDFVLMAVSFVAFVASSIYSRNRNDINTVYCVFAFLAFLLIVGVYTFRKSTDKYLTKETLKKITAVLCITSVAFNGMMYMLPSGENYIKRYISNTHIKNLKYKADEAIFKQADLDGEEGFYRAESRAFKYNSGTATGMNGSTFYYSLSNGNVSRFRQESDILSKLSYFYCGNDDRAAIDALASVKYYYLSKKNSVVPYGFKKTQTKNVYVNKYALPLGYTYDSYMTYEQLQSYDSAVGKQAAMLESIVLDEPSQAVASLVPETEAIELDYEFLPDSDKVEITENGQIIVKGKNASVTLYIKPVVNAETYVVMDGFDWSENYRNPSKATGLYQKLKNFIKKLTMPGGIGDAPVITFCGTKTNGKEVTKTTEFVPEKNSFYEGDHSITANIGYSKKGYEKISISFSDKGVYSFDSIRVIAQPMENFEGKTDKLKENVLEDVEIGANLITGNITLEETKLLCLSVPYSEGWTAYVDGEEQEILRANIMYSALELTEGEHTVELRYNTPGFKTGIIISFVGWIVFFAAMWYYNIYAKKRKKREGRKSDEN